MSSPSQPLSTLAPTPPCVAAPDDGHRWFNDEVHPHDGQLKAYLRAKFPSVRDVDDIAQESYLRMWKARTAHPIQSAKAFLFKVAGHLALDFVRKAKRSPLESESDLAASRVLDTAPDAAQCLTTQEMIDYVSDAIVALPTRCREVIMLHKVMGLPQKEVAQKLGLSSRTVENYCQRGLKRCEEILRAKGIHGFLG